MPPFELEKTVAAPYCDGSSEVANAGPANPYGSTDSPLGVLRITRNGPHRGELHPGGDEATSAEEQVEALHPGEAIVVPKGVWHRVDIREPSRLVHITPGPGSGHRPHGTTG